jgi:hypothetical protein
MTFEKECIFCGKTLYVCEEDADYDSYCCSSCYRDQHDLIHNITEENYN